MKATGVVRRIDELGRIVIPKEIRKNFRIREGENIEIFISDDDSIVLKKQSTLNNLNDLANIITESIYQINNKNVLITDTNNIISIEGDLKKEYKNQNLSSDFFKLLESRTKIIEKKISNIKIIDQELRASYIITPILINGDLMGSIIILSDSSVDNVDVSLSDVALKILTKYIEQ